MPETSGYGGKPPVGPVPLYAATIHRCIAGGDLAKMKALAKEAETHLHEHGNVSAALEALKIEIAKLEK
jgi:hypothetical protein